MNTRLSVKLIIGLVVIGLAWIPACVERTGRHKDDSGGIESESVKIKKRFSQPISCRFEEAEIKDVARFFSKETGIGVVLYGAAIGEIKQKISVQIDNVPAGDALRQILQPLGLDFWQQETIIYISVPSNLAMTAMRFIGEMPNEAERIEALKQALQSENKYLREEAKKELQNRQLHH